MTQAGYFETRRFNPGSFAMAAAIEIALIGGAVAWQLEETVRDKPVPTNVFHVDEMRDDIVPPKKPDQVEQKRRNINHEKPVVEISSVTPEPPVWVFPERPIVDIPPIPSIPADTPKLEPARAKGDVRALLNEDDYPEAARRRDETGTVRALLNIGVSGRVTGCKIVASSGSPRLDSTTCSLLKDRARFTPAKNGNGELVSDTYITPKIVWAIERTG